MIGSQSDFNRIVFDDYEIKQKENQILERSRTVVVVLYGWSISL